MAEEEQRPQEEQTPQEQTPQEENNVNTTEVQNSATIIGSGSGANTISDNTMVEELSKKRKNLISASYESPGSKNIDRKTDKAIIDIISNYAWTNETSISSSLLSYSSKTNIPYCLVVEREQTVSSSIMNIIRDVSIIGQGIGKIITELSRQDQKLEKLAKDATQQAKKILDGATSNQTAARIVQSGKEVLQKAKVSGNELNTGILSPYNYLYATEMTGFRYVFPMLSSQDLYALSTSWTDQQDANTSILLHNPLTNIISEGAAAVANTIGADVPNIVNTIFKNANGANKASAFEMARYFNFDRNDTDEIKISFVLFNTIVKNGKLDQWKNNLYFISLFNMRNLPFKLDYTTYLPPLLYDVIIPGVKRLPFTYVSSFTAEPQGLIRNMKIDNFLAKIGGVKSSSNDYVSVPVPEAWTISITFKSMLARSANLMLAGGADLPITINMSNNEYKEVADKLNEIDNALKDVDNLGDQMRDQVDKEDRKVLTVEPKDEMSDVKEMQQKQYVSSELVEEEEVSIFDEEKDRLQQTRVTSGKMLDEQAKQQQQQQQPAPQQQQQQQQQQSAPQKNKTYNYEPSWDASEYADLAD